jgi:hypothetical protein
MKFTEPELAYLRRFCWEVFHDKDGPGTTIYECRGHFNDLSDLAKDAGVAPEIVDTACSLELRDTPPPATPFPWRSSEHLRQRAQGLTLQESAV